MQQEPDVLDPKYKNNIPCKIISIVALFVNYLPHNVINIYH